MKIMALFVAALLVSGCTSTFKTSKFDPVTWKPVGESIEGVVYYEPHQIKVTYSFTALVKDGVVLGTADEGKCRLITQKEEIVVEPNFREPRVLINVPGLFATNKLGVTLNNGMLTAVNTESSPRAPEMIKEITGLLKEAGALPLAFDGTAPLPACNSAPAITKRQAL